MKTLMSRQRQSALIAQFLPSSVPYHGLRMSRDDETFPRNFSLEKEEASSSFDYGTIFVVSVTLGGILLLSASILNLHELWHLWTNRKRWCSTHVCLFGLAVSDLLVVLLALPGFVLYTIHNDTWPLGMNSCFVWLYIDWITTLTTSSLVMIILISQIIIFHVPQFLKQLPNKLICTAAAIFGVVVYANTLFLPVFLHDTVGIHGMASSGTVCFIQTFDHSQWLLAYSVCGCYIPMLVIVGCCLALGRKAMQSDTSSNFMVASWNSGGKNLTRSVLPFQEAIKTRYDLEHSVILAMGVIFVICWLPAYIYNFLKTYANYESHLWDMVSVWMIYLCAVLNPIALHVPKIRGGVLLCWQSAKLGKCSWRQKKHPLEMITPCQRNWAKGHVQPVPSTNLQLDKLYN